MMDDTVLASCDTVENIEPLEPVSISVSVGRTKLTSSPRSAKAAVWFRGDGESSDLRFGGWWLDLEDGVW